MSQLIAFTKNDVINIDSIPLISELECPIDSVIPLDPVICISCQTIFCKKCIETWQSQGHNICPKRCSPLVYKSFEGSILEQQYHCIRLKCKNYKYGCMKPLTLKLKKQHELTCEFNQKQCSYCEEYIVIQEEFYHLYNDCAQFKVECLYCKERFGLSEIKEHVDKCKIGFQLNRDEFKIEKCAQCGMFDKKEHKCKEDWNGKDIAFYYRLSEWSEKRMKESIEKEMERVEKIGNEVEMKRKELEKMKLESLDTFKQKVLKEKNKLRNICGETIRKLKMEIENEQQEINDIKDAIENMEGYQEKIEEIKKEIENEKSVDLLEKINAYEEIKLKLKQELLRNSNLKDNSNN